MRTTLIGLTLVCVSGCVGGGSDDVTSGRVLLSDGSRGGDLVEAQMRADAETVGCIETEFRDIYWRIVWPEGQAECLRHATNLHAHRNEPAIDCAIETYEALAECYRDDACTGSGGQYGDCTQVFADDFQRCPQLDELAQQSAIACFE